MRKLALLSVVVLLSLPVTGCIQAPVVPPLAMIYTSFEAPLDVDFQQTSLGSKVGQSSCMNILGLVATGDASSQAAAEEGGLTTILGADYSYLNVLGIYQRYTTIVYGE